MRGLDILPVNSDVAPQPQPRPPDSGGGSASSSQSQWQQQVVVEVGSSYTNCEAPVLPEGELNEMLENMLLSFERQIGSGAAREEAEPDAQSRDTPPVDHPGPGAKSLDSKVTK